VIAVRGTNKSLYQLLSLRDIVNIIDLINVSLDCDIEDDLKELIDA